MGDPSVCSSIVAGFPNNPKRAAVGDGVADAVFLNNPIVTVENSRNGSARAARIPSAVPPPSSIAAAAQRLTPRTVTATARGRRNALWSALGAAQAHAAVPLAAAFIAASLPRAAQGLASESRGRGLPGQDGRSLFEIDRIFKSDRQRLPEGASSVSMAAGGRVAATLPTSTRRGPAVVRASLGGGDVRWQAPVGHAALVGTAEAKMKVELATVAHVGVKGPPALQGTGPSLKLSPSPSPSGSPAAAEVAAPTAPKVSLSGRSSTMQPVASVAALIGGGPRSASISAFGRGEPPRTSDVGAIAGVADGMGAGSATNASSGQETTAAVASLTQIKEGSRVALHGDSRLGAQLTGAFTTLRFDAASGSGLRPLAIFVACAGAVAICGTAVWIFMRHHRFPDGPTEATPQQYRRGAATESIASSEEPLSQISETTEHFAARLEEIIEQLSTMLKGTMRTYPKDAEMGDADNRTWWYVAALPGAASGNTPISRDLVKWSSGCLGWWPSMDAFAAREQPAGSVPLGKITGISNDDADPTLVIVVAENQADRMFQFRTWKEAKTWASTLAALIEQLHDEY